MLACAYADFGGINSTTGHSHLSIKPVEAAAVMKHDAIGDSVRMHRIYYQAVLQADGTYSQPHDEGNAKLRPSSPADVG
jgi:hypothetical protein